MSETKGTPPTSASPGPEAAPGAATEDILVVDDNRANLVAIESALQGLAGQVVTASSGPEALRYLLERDFALLLLDIQMPTMDGFETARLIRARQRTRHTPIIFITAHNRNDEDVLRAYRLGAVDFLHKPIVAGVLRAKASVFLELQRRAAEVARQAELLQEHARREHELELAEARRRWEEELLRQQVQLERRAAAETSRRADELTRTVAELERAEAELVRMNRQLAESDRRKDEFLAILAHELRNPLAPIVNSLGLLKVLLQQNENEKLFQAGQAIERQVHHLTRLVDDLLDLSRINSGKIELRCQRILLAEVISQAVALSQSRIEEKNHRLQVQLPEEPIEIVADFVRLSQVVANLLGNAARYTDPGGLIELSCRREASSVQITVRDTGKGIPSHQLESIFDMFVQGQSGTGGLGIGLSLVRSIVHLHGGTVSASSAGLNHGSVFTVDLPAADHEAALALAETSEAPDSRSTRQLRVAVVEDNPDVRETLGALLRGWGHEVLQAADGLQAVDLILDQTPDIALVDLGLPGLDGYEVARTVRARGATKVRLVAVSGYGRDCDRQRALDSGFDLHLVKPAAAETLLQALDLVTWSRSDSSPP